MNEAPNCLYKKEDNMDKLRAGDRVELKTGTGPILVIDHIYCDDAVCHSLHKCKNRCIVNERKPMAAYCHWFEQEDNTWRLRYVRLALDSLRKVQ